ncbi:MAG: PH domain-containing protein [Candidatus Bathyarchaeota archaeon]|nr:PH domain-containing protein [Candidatus Bathyarchaeota archaeon]
MKKMSSNTLKSDLINELPSGVKANLSLGETVVHYLRTFQVFSKPDYIILTNIRLVYFNEKHLGRYDFRSLPFQKLLKMDANRGIFLWGNISFKNEDGTLIFLKLVSRGKMEGFIEALKISYNNIAVEPITIEYNNKLFGRATWEFNKPKEIIFRQSSDQTKQPDDPLNQLKIRYIRGEITENEYRDKLRVLQGG